MELTADMDCRCASLGSSGLTCAFGAWSTLATKELVDGTGKGWVLVWKDYSKRVQGQKPRLNEGTGLNTGVDLRVKDQWEQGKVVQGRGNQAGEPMG